jgi:TRAP-type mannitol/chloroaromatic compound transport system permease small subunit
MEDFFNTLTGYVPQLIAAVAILVVGWIVAAAIANGVRKGLDKTKLGSRIAGWIAGDAADVNKFDIWAGRVVFYVLLLFVLVGFFQVLGLSEVTRPLVGFLNEIFLYAPRLLGPAVLVVVAWVLAKGFKLIVQRGCTAMKLDQRLGEQADFSEADRVPMSQTLGEAAYWITLLLFVPAIVGALDLRGLLDPMRNMVHEILAYLPNLLAAGLILFVGWILARILRQIVVRVLHSVGLDSLSARAQLSSAIGDQSLTALIGLIVYILVLVPIIIAALNALQLESITAPASNMLNGLLGALPMIFAAFLLLAVAYVVAKIVSGLVQSVLSGIGFDTIPQRIGLGTGATGAYPPSTIVAGVVLVTVMIFAGVEALRLVGFDAAAELGSDFLVFGANILVGLAVIGLGLFLSILAADALNESEIRNAAVLALVARWSIVVLSLAMGLGQMGVGEEIIMLAFGILFGALALAAAIAIGVGSRDTAGRLVAEWVETVNAGSASKTGTRGRASSDEK